MKLLVVGGAGYIGSVVAAQLIEAGHTVTVADNLSKGHDWAVPPEATFVQVDVLDAAAGSTASSTSLPSPSSASR
jgi:UDP-glucose 4-epimerase